MAITDWLEAERPREKLLARGAKNLSDAELLAIFLRTGMRGKTALDLAQDLLSEYGSLKKLLAIPLSNLTNKRGLGSAKAAALKAAVEVGLRFHAEILQIGDRLDNATAAKNFLIQRLCGYQQEVFACLFLDSRHCVLAFEELFFGTINESSVYPREVVKRGLANNAAEVILTHNHPSGNPTPSEADRDITFLLKQALGLVDIKVIDHIIVGHQKCLSLAELGQI
jgi:DNA repair protein RadC